MFSISRSFSIPRRIHNRRLVAWRPPKSSMLDAPPPPDTVDVDQCFGDYCIKATVEAENETYMGYGQDMSVAVKTRYVCERMGKSCSDPEIVFKGGKCEEVIFVKRADGTMYIIS